jgi:hypothetical protein
VAGFYAANAELALRFAEPPFAALPAAMPPATPDGTNGSHGGGGSVAPAQQAAGAVSSPVTASALAMATYHGSFAADRGSGFASEFAAGVLLPLDALAAEVEQVGWSEMCAKAERKTLRVRLTTEITSLGGNPIDLPVQIMHMATLNFLSIDILGEQNGKPSGAPPREPRPLREES